MQKPERIIRVRRELSKPRESSNRVENEENGDN